MTQSDGVPTWIGEFHGVVHPVGGGWGYDAPYTLDFPDQQWVIVIRQSRFSVVVSGRPPADLQTFRNEIMSIVGGLLDSLGFHLGVALTPEFEGGFASPGVLVLPGLGWPELTGRGPAEDLRVDPADLQPLVEASHAEPLVRHALADLSMGIARPDDSVFYAHRAVESVRQYFVREIGTLDKKASWKALRDALGYTEDELQTLSKDSRSSRHGAIVPISEEERLSALRLGRDVVLRLVQYRSRAS